MLKRTVIPLLVFALIANFPLLLLADIEGSCVSQYCACDGQMHPCDFSEEQCKALCGGGNPQGERYHDPNMDVLLISFLVSFAIIGLIIWASGGLNNMDRLNNPVKH